jgi:hypothetical protein
MIVGSLLASCCEKIVPVAMTIGERRSRMMLYTGLGKGLKLWLDRYRFCPPVVVDLVKGMAEATPSVVGEVSSELELRTQLCSRPDNNAWRCPAGKQSRRRVREKRPGRAGTPSG